tara:strand:- start:6284 stop:13291 length:7008 start_codon:yes stop_codon:yes gene_type:complete
MALDMAKLEEAKRLGRAAREQGGATDAPEALSFSEKLEAAKAARDAARNGDALPPEEAPPAEEAPSPEGVWSVGNAFDPDPRDWMTRMVDRSRPRPPETDGMPAEGPLPIATLPPAPPAYPAQAAPVAQPDTPPGVSWGAAPPGEPKEAASLSDEVFNVIGTDSIGTLAQRLVTRNLGRAWGVAMLPSEEWAGALSHYKAAGDAVRITNEIRELRALPGAESNPHAIAFAEKLEKERNVRREFAREYHSKTLSVLKEIEDTIEKRVSASGLGEFPSRYSNLEEDSSAVGKGMYHLVFLDILGLDGESDASAAMPDVDSWATLIDYSKVVFGEGVNRGGELGSGLAGLTMALSATMLPQSSHDLADRLLGVDEDNDWRSNVGMLDDAFNAMPISSALFALPVIRRGVDRFRGNMATNSPAWKVTRDHFEKAYGKNSPQFKAWLKGKGAVPPALMEAEVAATRVYEWASKNPVARNAPRVIDAAAQAAEGAEAAWVAGKAKGTALKDASFDKLGINAARGAAGSLAGWVRTQAADALSQADRVARLHLNQLIRSTAEVEVTPIGVSRRLSGEIRHGDPFNDPVVPGQARPPAAPEGPQLLLEGPGATKQLPPPKPKAPEGPGKRFRREEGEGAPVEAVVEAELFEGAVPPARRTSEGGYQEGIGVKPDRHVKIEKRSNDKVKRDLMDRYGVEEGRKRYADWSRTEANLERNWKDPARQEAPAPPRSPATDGPLAKSAADTAYNKALDSIAAPFRNERGKFVKRDGVHEMTLRELAGKLGVTVQEAFPVLKRLQAAGVLGEVQAGGKYAVDAGKLRATRPTKRNKGSVEDPSYDRALNAAGGLGEVTSVRKATAYFTQRLGVHTADAAAIVERMRLEGFIGPVGKDGLRSVDAGLIKKGLESRLPPEPQTTWQHERPIVEPAMDPFPGPSRREPTVIDADYATPKASVEGVPVGKPYDPRGTGVAVRPPSARSTELVAPRDPYMPLVEPESAAYWHRQATKEATARQAAHSRRVATRQKKPGKGGVLVGHKRPSVPPKTGRQQVIDRRNAAEARAKEPYWPPKKGESSVVPPVAREFNSPPTAAEQFVHGAADRPVSSPPRTEQLGAYPKAEVQWFGILKTEWQGEHGFAKFAFDNFGDTPVNLVTKANSPWYRDGPGLARTFMEREGHSRPHASVRGDIHRFSPEEKSYWGAQVIRHKGAGHSLNKAEYKAYADVLGNRGLQVSSDINSLGLSIDQVNKAYKKGELSHLDNLIGEELMADGLIAMGMDAAKAKVQAAASWKTATEGGVSSQVAHSSNKAWQTPSKANAPKGEVFAEFNRLLNESVPGSGGKVREYGDLAHVVETVERGNGLRVTGERPSAVTQRPAPIEMTGSPVQQDLPMFTPEFKFNKEMTQTFKEAAKFVGVTPETLMKPMADILNWRSNTYFLKSRIAQRRLKDVFLERYRNWARENKLYDPGFSGGRKTLDAWVAKNEVFKDIDRYIRNMSMGWGAKRILYRDAANANAKPLSFDVLLESRKIMESDPAFMKEVLAEAVEAAGITVGTELSVARMKAFAAKEYKKAPADYGNTMKVIIDNFKEGTNGTPAYSRVAPSELIRGLNRRRELGKLDDVTPNDFYAMQRAINRMEVMPASMKEHMGLPAKDPIYASKKSISAIRLELDQQRMIKADGIFDKVLRTMKRGKVVLALPVAIRNAMSDANLIHLQSGRLTGLQDAYRSGKLMSEFQTGKMARPANPEWFDNFDALTRLERVRLVDSSLIEVEFGRSRHKGVLSALTDAEFMKGLPSERMRRVETFLEKRLAAPFIKTFRATTNAFKVDKALKTYKTVLEEQHLLEVGDVPAYEIYPDVYVRLEVIDGQMGFPGGKGFKNLETGKVVSPTAYKDIIARVSKVTSDKLFFDYGDSGAFIKMIRTQVAARWLMGSLYAMYYAKSAFIPGIQKGLMFEVMNPNPSYIPGNAAIRAIHHTRAAGAQARVGAMQAGARASMLKLPEQEDLMNKLSWNASDFAIGALASTSTPDSIDFFDTSNADFNESSRDLGRLIRGGYTRALIHSGALDNDSGELGVVWPLPTEGEYNKMSVEERMNYNLAHVKDPAKRRWHKSMREIVLREYEGRGAVWKDVGKVLLMQGGPLLDAVIHAMKDDSSSRVTDFQKLFTNAAYQLAGGTVGGLANVTIAAFDPTSNMSTFRYEIKDSEEWTKKPLSGQAKAMVRWAMKQLIFRGWDEKDLGEDNRARKWRSQQTKSALRQVFVKNWLDLAERNRSLAESSTDPGAKAEFLAKADAADDKAEWFSEMVDERMDEHEAMSENTLQGAEAIRKMRKGSTADRNARRLKKGLSRVKAQ